ncbi:MAG: hypothetical protein KatS3mg055_2545 [Chloroflexus sp.]|nr:MAG: hypothetical protein KatS3mg055_2545 [Chloroflexus sp.]
MGGRHVGATRRVAPTQWATRAMGDARDGRRGASPRREPARHVGPRYRMMRGTACRGTACRAPTGVTLLRGGGTAWRGDPAGDARYGRRTQLGNTPRRPDPNQHTVVGVRARYGMGGTACRGTACRAPTGITLLRGGGTAWRDNPAGRPDDGRRTVWATHAMGDAVRRPYVNRRGMWGHGTACGDTACRAPTGVTLLRGGGRHVGGRHVGATRRVAPMMGAPTMGDAVRRPYVNRRGMGGHGTACRGTACRAPTGVTLLRGGGTAWRGDPAGRPHNGQRTQWATHAMGDAPRRPYVNRHGM